MSSNDENETSESVLRPKKRLRNEKSYKKNKIKKARIQNEPYHNHRGRYVRANSHGFDCR